MTLVGEREKLRMKGSNMRRKIYTFILAIVLGGGVIGFFYYVFNLGSINEKNLAKDDLNSESSSNVNRYLSFDDSKNNVGIYMNDPKDIESLAIIPDIIGWYETWFGDESTDKIKMACDDLAYTPFITWQPSMVSLNDIANGKYDDYVTSFFSRLGSECAQTDVLLRFAHEMEWRPWYTEGWYTWQIANSEESYKNAWIHLNTISKELAPNVKWIWSPNRADQYTTAYYPGDGYVDYVSLSLNHETDHPYTYSDFGAFYENEGQKTYLEKYNKKIIISEIAYSSNNATTKANYLDSIFSYLENDPNIVGVVYFDFNIADNKQFKITDNPAYMQIFYNAIDKYRK